jgi:thioredoxin reductase (NADPH)
VQGPDLMVRMEEHARAMGAEVISDYITALDLSKRPFTATADSGTTYTADAVILATGAQAKWLGCPSRKSSRASASRPAPPATGSSIAGKEVVVIGGGNTAVEEALFLTNFARRSRWSTAATARAEKIMQDRLFKNPKIAVIWDSEVTEVLGTEAPLGVTGVKAAQREDRRRIRDCPATGSSSPSAMRPRPNW